MSGKAPVISIIIPVYNSVDKLSDAIESVLAQTYNDWELIIIDDGSNDGSASVCDEYEKKDSRIKVIHIENSGVSFARNLGIKLSRGIFLEFMDSDDYISNNALETSIGKIDDNDLLIFSFEYLIADIRCSIDTNYMVLNSWDELKKKFVYLDSKILINSPCNKIYKKDIIAKNNILFPTDLSLGEDLVFNLLYLKSCNKIKIISDLLYHYLDENKNSLSRKKREDFLEIQKKLKIYVDDCFQNDLEIESHTSLKFASQVIKSLKYLLRNKGKSFEEKYKIVSHWVKDVTFCKSVKLIGFDSLNVNFVDKLSIKCRLASIWILLYNVRNAIKG